MRVPVCGAMVCLVGAVAGRATVVPDQASRVAVYGSIISTCANCHGLHVRIWGPSLPKAE